MFGEGLSSVLSFSYCDCQQKLVSILIWFSFRLLMYQMNSMVDVLFSFIIHLFWFKGDSIVRYFVMCLSSLSLLVDYFYIFWLHIFLSQLRTVMFPSNFGKRNTEKIFSLLRFLKHVKKKNNEKKSVDVKKKVIFLLFSWKEFYTKCVDYNYVIVMEQLI